MGVKFYAEVRNIEDLHIDVLDVIFPVEDLTLTVKEVFSCQSNQLSV